MKYKYTITFIVFFFLLNHNLMAQCLPTPTSTYTQDDFGNNEWVAHIYDYDSGADDVSQYNPANFDTVNNYQGYYIDAGYGISGMSFDSSNYFGLYSNPTNASTYEGCSMLDDNTYNVVYKRKGFPAAPNYIISLVGAGGEPGHDDAAQLYIDGVLVWSNTECCKASLSVWSGPLNGNSEVVFMWSERAGRSYGRMSIETTSPTPPEDISFGNYQWKVGAYNGSYFNTYYGNYIHDGVSFDTRDMWDEYDNPSMAAGYMGIQLPSNNQHSYVYRREGFDCGYYNLDILRHDDDIEVIIDGVTVYQKIGWDNNNSTLNVWDGYLDSYSQVEIKMKETGGNSLLAIDLSAVFGQANDPDEYIWVGEVDTDPVNAANWCGAVPPNDGSASISISNNAAYFPVYSTTLVVNNLKIESAAEVTLNNGVNVDIRGDFDNEGVLLVSGGEVQFKGVNTQNVTGNGFEVAYLEVNNPAGVTLALDASESIAVYDVLAITSGTLTTNDQIILACTFTPTRKTAQIDDLSGGTISGNITAEQCFPARRAFRFVSSSLTTSTSIQDNFQEGVNNTGTSYPTDNLNPNAGYGTHITGSTTGQNGLDATPSGNPSMYTYNNVGGTWSSVTNTDTNTLNAGEPYRLLVRGDRSINVTSNSATPTNTKLRVTGNVTSGDIDQNSFSDTDGDFNFFGNPYHASIDVYSLFVDMATSNVNANFYYVWDPTLGGSPVVGSSGGRGAYVTVDLTTGTNSSGSDANRYLQPMQAAFFATGNLGTTPNLHFTEALKNVTEEQTSVFGTASSQTDGFINVKLYNEDAFLNNETVSDGLKIKFSSTGDNNFTNLDAPKLGNQDENLGRTLGQQIVSLENRSLPQDGEVLPLFINQYRRSNYVFDVELNNIEGVRVYLKDNYLNTSVEITSQANTVSFQVDESIAESVASDRFEIVFEEETLSTGTITETNIAVYPNPFTGNELSIQLSSTITGKVNVQLFDILGKNVFTESKTAAGNNITLENLNLNSGVYLLKVSTEKGQSYVKKIVKN